MRPPFRAASGPRVLFATLLAMPSPRVPPILLSASPRRRSFASKPNVPGDLPEAEVWTGSITPRLLSENQKKVVAYRQKYQCAGCDCLLPPSYQVDHIKPLALGGTNGLTNLQALCTRCHTSKTRRQRHDILASRAAREATDAADADVAIVSHEYDLLEDPEEQGGFEEAASDVDGGAAAAGSGASDGGDGAGAMLGLDSLELSSLKLLRGMNQQQLAAVVCADGPMRVAAGPGTGKTRVLTARIAHLIVEANVPPQRVLAVTFTNKAARELRERITTLIGPDEADSVTMGTFHSLCLAMLRVDIEKLPTEVSLPRNAFHSLCPPSSAVVQWLRAAAVPCSSGEQSQGEQSQTS